MTNAHPPRPSAADHGCPYDALLSTLLGEEPAPDRGARAAHPPRPHPRRGGGARRLSAYQVDGDGAAPPHGAMAAGDGAPRGHHNEDDGAIKGRPDPYLTNFKRHPQLDRTHLKRLDRHKIHDQKMPRSPRGWLVEQLRPSQSGHNQRGGGDGGGRVRRVGPVCDPGEPDPPPSPHQLWVEVLRASQAPRGKTGRSPLTAPLGGAQWAGRYLASGDAASPPGPRAAEEELLDALPDRLAALPSHLGGEGHRGGASAYGSRRRRRGRTSEAKLQVVQSPSLLSPRGMDGRVHIKRRVTADMLFDLFDTLEEAEAYYPELRERIGSLSRQKQQVWREQWPERHYQLREQIDAWLPDIAPLEKEQVKVLPYDHLRQHGVLLARQSPIPGSRPGSALPPGR